MMAFIRRHHGRRGARQAGFTMIELMVSVALAGLLMAGVMQIYIASKQAYRLHENLSRMQETGRYVIQIMKRYGQMGGLLYPKATNPAAVTDTGNADDNIVFNFTTEASRDQIRECDGGGDYDDVDPNDGSQALAYFNVNSTNGVLGLHCALANGSIGNQIAAYVVNMRGGIGVNPTINALTPSLNRYTWWTATEYVAQGSPAEVFAVRVAFLVRSVDEVLLEPESRSYLMLDKTVTKNDRYLYQLYTITIPLRSRGQ